MALVRIFSMQAVFGLITIGIAVYVIRQVFWHPLAKFPGPLAAKLSKIWRAQLTAKGSWHRDIVALHKKYGNVVRIGPNELSIGDLDTFRTIYKAGNGFAKAECYSVVQGSRPFDLTGERNEQVHAEQRRLVARAYSMESMVHLEPRVDMVLVALLEKLDALSGTVIDLGKWLQYFAFDIIGVTSFSRPYGFVDSGDDNGMFHRIERSMASISWLMHAGWFFQLHNRFQPIFGNFLAANDRNGYFFEIARAEVNGRKDRGGDAMDIVGQLRRVQQDKPQLDDLSITFMMTSNVYAGSDTTSIALRSIFLNILSSPAVLARLREELAERELTGVLSDRVSFEETEKWMYLQAVLYEAMRVHPPAGFMLDREVPASGMEIGGHFVPSKTVVGSSAWVIHHSVEIWGDDATVFKPERWLNVDGSFRSDLKRNFFAFGGGTRTCIGRNLSWLEISKVVVTLLRRYEMHLVSNLDVKEEFGALVFLKGLQVNIRKRVTA